MVAQLRKAERKQAKMRVGITAPSGGGKTYSALLMARGLATSWDKVALIDTENGSGELYAHLGAYNVLTLDAPFTPERYIEAIRACEKAGIEVIVVDSSTHEWDGPGGCLEIKDSLGGKYQDWAKVTPRHQKFLNALLQSCCDIVTTTRRKQDYEMTKDSNGKVTVEKVGLREVQRDGYEYELTLNFELDIRHNAIASKDRTGLFMDKPAFVITEETGRALKVWCESGAPAAVATAPPAAPINGTRTTAPVLPADDLIGPNTPGEPETPVTITAVVDKPYTQGNKPHIGYLLTFSDGREARTTDGALGNRAKSYLATHLPVVPVCETRNGKLVIVEFETADPIGF
jgi:hypothetical protein